ncbi:MAG: DUF1592 domain-containing protein [Pirellulales bacterium]
MPNLYGFFLIIVIAVLGSTPAKGAKSEVEIANEKSAKVFRSKVQPLLNAHCYRCHNEETQEADLRLDNLSLNMVTGPAGETWHDVLNNLNLGEMPPEDEPELSERDRKTIVDWLSQEMRRAIEVRRSTGGNVVLRRLTRYEYNNTMRDLLGIDLDYAAELPPDSKSVDGFENNGTTLGMSPLQFEYYLQTARMALSKVIVSGAKPEVFHQISEETEKASKKTGPTSNRIDSSAKFVMQLDEFPREGEVRIRVRAHAEVPVGDGFPRMQVGIGLVSDVFSPEESLKQIFDVTAGSDDPQVYDFFGRIEDFPLPGKNPKFPGIKVKVRNIYKEPGTAVKVKPVKKDKKDKSKDEVSSEPPMPLTEPVIVIESVEFEGPYLKSWPPVAHRNILFDSLNSANELVYTEEVLHRFMQRAYRRPVASEEVDPLIRFFKQVRQSSPTFEHAIRETLAMVLISPDFLYLVEPKESSKKKQALTEHELASRLSYFLWSTMPDEQLFELANHGELSNPKVLEQQVQRMIADPKSWNFVQNFTSQWLNLSGLERIAINPEYYPDFDNRLKNDMRLETQHFFAHLLKQDLSCLNLLDSDFTLLNHRLAKHYGMSGPRTSEFELVKLQAANHRGGLLTQGSTLLINSTGEDSHPIKRGVWLLERVLDDPAPPPPPDVPSLDENEVDLTKLPVKQQLEIHREKSACNSCHRGIDPWGIPFENYDAVGLWRTEVLRVLNRKTEIKIPVETDSVLPSGDKISGLESLKEYLLENEKDRFSEAVVRKLMAYGLGRSVEFTDQATVNLLTKRFQQNDYRLKDLIVDIVQSEPFTIK